MIREFLDDVRGTMSVLFAGSIVVLVALLGFAVDYGIAQSKHEHLQDALDAAVLAAASSTAEDKEGVVRQVLMGSLPMSTFSALSIAVDSSNASELSGRIAYVQQALFLPILGYRAIPVEVRATAARPGPATVSATFKSEFAQGWYAKDIYLFARDTDGNIAELKKVLSYDYDFASDTKTFEPPIDEITETYDITSGGTVGVMMRVWPDTVDIGSRDGAYVDYYSDDIDARIRKSGECEDGQTHKWEDGGNEDHRDFIYVMTCESGEIDRTAIRLKQ